MEKIENRKIRWGILGAGSIITRWMNGAMQLSEEMEFVGLASRTKESAQKTAERYGIPLACTYDELIGRDDIDVYYVASPHTAHLQLAEKVLKKGKAVLVEKPAGINAKQFEQMVQCAADHHAFLMEAVWTRFFPAVTEAKKIIASGKIGEVRLIESAFAFRNEDVSSRLLDPNRAGGGLLDTGVYNLHFAQMILDKAPKRITGYASIDTDELHLQIDEQASYLAQYDKGELAVMTSAVRTAMPDTASIYGTKGSITLPVFWKPAVLEVTVDGKTERIEKPVPQKVDGVIDEGYQFEIAHVNECLRNGLTESPVLPLDRTRNVLEQCDELRNQWGLVYPDER